MKILEVLAQDFSSSRTSCNLCRVVVQSVILYGSETWEMAESMAEEFERAHQSIA